MPKRLLSSLSWKAGVAAAAFALAAGTGATTVNFVNSSDDKPAVTSTDTHEANEHADDHSKDDHAKDADENEADDDDVKTADTDVSPADAQEHPDNFGKTVSADARDGGVDGQEISDMAHAKNDERKGEDGVEADEADDDHGKADADHGKADDDHGDDETDD